MINGELRKAPSALLRMLGSLQEGPVIAPPLFIFFAEINHIVSFRQDGLLLLTLDQEPYCFR